MEKQEGNKIFSDIDKLYSEYYEVFLKKNDADFKEKYAIAYKSARDKLIIAVCKLYFKFEHKEGSCKNIPPVTKRNKNNDNYSDIVLLETVKAMDEYQDSDSRKKGYSFSNYVCMKINYAKGKEYSKNIASSNQGGSEISDYEAAQIRRVLKKDKELIKFGIYDENKRNEKIAMLLSTNSYAMTVEAVIRFKQLGTCQTTEIEVETSEGKTYSVIDSEKNRTEKNHITPESEYLKNEQSVYLEKLFCEIDDIYAKKNDVRESEIFTVALLKPFQVEKKNYVQENGSLQDFYPDIYAILAKYNCIDKAILRPFFEECDYCLPTQEEIEKKYGLNKKYAGTLLMRFRESFSGSKNIKEYFYDYLKKK